MEKHEPTEEFRRSAVKDRSIIEGETQKAYHEDQQALFGSRYVRASVYYEYIPSEFMKDGKPFVISQGINFDAGTEHDEAVAKGALTVSDKTVRKTFPNNWK